MGPVLRHGVQRIELRRWSECAPSDTFMEIEDTTFALNFLSDFRENPIDMMALRRALAEVSPYAASMPTLGDHEICRHLAQEIVRGNLRLIVRQDTSVAPSMPFLERAQAEPEQPRSGGRTSTSERQEAFPASRESAAASGQQGGAPAPEKELDPFVKNGYPYEKAWSDEAGATWNSATGWGEEDRAPALSVAVAASHTWKEGEKAWRTYQAGGGELEALSAGYEVSSGVTYDVRKREFSADLIRAKVEASVLKYEDEHTELKALSAEASISSGITYNKKTGEFAADLIKANAEASVLKGEVKGNLFGNEDVTGRLAAEVLSAKAEAGIGVQVTKTSKIAYAEAGAEANLAKVEGEATWAIPIPFTGRKIVLGVSGEASVGAKAKIGARAGYDQKHGYHVQAGAKLAVGLGLGAGFVLGIK